MPSPTCSASPSSATCPGGASPLSLPPLFPSCLVNSPPAPSRLLCNAPIVLSLPARFRRVAVVSSRRRAVPLPLIASVFGGGRGILGCADHCALAKPQVPRTPLSTSPARRLATRLPVTGTFSESPQLAGGGGQGWYVCGPVVEGSRGRGGGGACQGRPDCPPVTGPDGRPPLPVCGLDLQVRSWSQAISACVRRMFRYCAVPPPSASVRSCKPSSLSPALSTGGDLLIPALMAPDPLPFSRPELYLSAESRLPLGGSAGLRYAYVDRHAC